MSPATLGRYQKVIAAAFDLTKEEKCEPWLEVDDDDDALINAALVIFAIGRFGISSLRGIVRYLETGDSLKDAIGKAIVPITFDQPTSLALLGDDDIRRIGMLPNIIEQVMSKFGKSNAANLVEWLSAGIPVLESFCEMIAGILIHDALLAGLAAEEAKYKGHLNNSALW